MKIFSPAEIKQAREAEITKEITRTQSVKDALDKVTKELNDTEARFEVALSNQRLRWAKEEEEATNRLNKIQYEIAQLEKQRKELRIPMDEELKKAHNLFKEAEEILKSAKIRESAANQKMIEVDQKSQLLEEKLDEVSDREQEALELGRKNTIRSLTIDEERQHIKKLSEELSIKLSKL